MVITVTWFLGEGGGEMLSNWVFSLAVYARVHVRGLYSGQGTDGIASWHLVWWMCRQSKLEASALCFPENTRTQLGESFPDDDNLLYVYLFLGITFGLNHVVKSPKFPWFTSFWMCKTICICFFPNITCDGKARVYLAES